jgi:hypothetical protein
MTAARRVAVAIAVVGVVWSAPLRAQERFGSGAPEPAYQPGWTFTPIFGFAGAYDDNISLFAERTAEEQNNDMIATIFPGADLHYRGRHSNFGANYGGSFLDYRTYSSLNRWDQSAGLNFDQQTSERMKWYVHGSGAVLPSTDLVDLGGIPFRQTGARTLEGRAGLEYVLSPTSAVTVASGYQDISFDRPLDIVNDLRGGHVFETLGTYRRKLDERLAVGGDYSYRIASVFGESEDFNIHTALGAVDYALSPGWTLSGGAGIVYLQQTSITAAHTGPAWRVSLDRHHASATFHIGYARSYIPSFGFGGTIANQEVALGFHLPLFHSRHFYTTNSAVFRDDSPLTDTALQLPLRSLRTYSILGWQPGPYVRIEGFYSRVDQSSLRAGGQLYRDRVGFQIVTSKPMRIQ